MLTAITTRTSTPQEDAEPWPGGTARPVLAYLTGTLGMTDADASELLKAARTAQAETGPGALADYPVPGGTAHLLIHYAPGNRAYRFKLTTLNEVRPGTSEEPGTMPGNRPAPHGPSHSGQPGEAQELAAWAAGLGLEAGDLDDLVHDAYSKQASETNNDGLGSQVKFLIESYGTEGARSLLSDLLPQTERARLRRRAKQRPPSAPRG